jgi:hypothetical protein
MKYGMFSMPDINDTFEKYTIIYPIVIVRSISIKSASRIILNVKNTGSQRKFKLSWRMKIMLPTVFEVFVFVFKNM